MVRLFTLNAFAALEHSSLSFKHAQNLEQPDGPIFMDQESKKKAGNSARGFAFISRHHATENLSPPTLFPI